MRFCRLLTTFGTAAAILLSALVGPAPAGARTSAERAFKAYAKNFRKPGTLVRPKIGVNMPAEPGPEDLKKQLEEYKAAGFSGMVLGFGGATALVDGGFPKTQVEGLTIGFREAKRLGMTIDLPLGAGWPLKTKSTAGDRKSPNHQQELTYGSLDVLTPYTGPLPPGKDMGVPILTGTASGQEYNPGTFVAAAAGKVLEEGTPPVYHGPSVPYQPGAAGVFFPFTHPAKSTVLDPSSLVDVTKSVSEGTVSFTPPSPGHWVLFAFYVRPSSQDTVNHLRAEAAQAALRDLEEDQITPKNLHEFPKGSMSFQDSLELFHAGIPWTQGFLDFFKRRRGYDLTPYLPALYIQGAYQMPGFDPGRPLPNADWELPGDKGRRVRHDYEQTLNDLYAEQHLDVFAKWAKGIGIRQRAQVAYGTRFDQVRAARELATAGGVVDVEQLNAGDPVGRTSSNWWFAMDLYRAASGGAHQGGLKELSSETGSTFGRGSYIASSLSEVKGLFDKQLAAGITTPILTGTWTTPADSWPQANVLFNDWLYKFRPEWRQMRALTNYIARAARVLRTGRPQTDVAIYRDAPTTIAAALAHIPLSVIDHNADAQSPIPIFHDSSGGYSTDILKLRNPSPFFDTRPLEERGYSLEYLDPAGLTDKRAPGKGVLYPKGPTYRALVIDQRSMPADAAERLAEASRTGLRVVVVGAAPNAGAGLATPDEEDARVKAAFSKILASPRTRVVDAQAKVRDALAALGVRPRFSFSEDAPVYTQMRRTKHGGAWFMWNAGEKTAAMTGSFAGKGQPRVLDLWTGAVTRPAAYRATRRRVELPLSLRPGETKVITLVGKRARKARHVVSTNAQDVRLAGRSVIVSDTRGGTRTVRFTRGRRRTVRLGVLPKPVTPQSWKLHVEESAPEPKTHDLELTELADWRQIPGIEEVSGVGTYTSTVELPAGWTGRRRGALLDLGQVCGSIEVYVNGRRVPGSAAPDTPYTIPLPAIPRITAPFDIGRYLRRGPNEVKVVVATSLANEIRSYSQKGGTAAPGGAAIPTQPYGLMGPVKLLPVGKARIALRR